MKSVIILGRQPAISLAELETLFGGEKNNKAGATYAILDVANIDIPFARLGGAMKLGEIMGYVAANNLATELAALISQALPAKQGKINFGISAYELLLSPNELGNLALTIKTRLKKRGYSIRTIPNRDTALNTAQVWHNRLTSNRGLELLLIGQGKTVLVARTTNVQDIESYTIRDRARPKRDAKVGMLPPKLAQIIINLAVADKQPDTAYLLDPFCGTGVILQEAMLMGYNALGTDIEPRMIDYSTANLEWLNQECPDLKAKFSISPADARSANWRQPILAVASETYLGPVFYSPPSDTRLTSIVSDLNLLHKQFLQNLAEQIPIGTRLCLAVPAWRVKNCFWHLPILDQLTKLGYNRVAFKYAKSDQLIYHRPDQIVARELVVLIRK
jgi:tRNA G10  N-methylase Trm11